MSEVLTRTMKECYIRFFSCRTDGRKTATHWLMVQMRTIIIRGAR